MKYSNALNNFFFLYTTGQLRPELFLYLFFLLLRQMEYIFSFWLTINSYLSLFRHLFYHDWFTPTHTIYYAVTLRAIWCQCIDLKCILCRMSICVNTIHISFILIFGDKLGTLFLAAGAGSETSDDESNYLLRWQWIFSFYLGGNLAVYCITVNNYNELQYC